VTQLSQTTQQNASSSEELAATAEEMSGQAEQLQQAMSFFKLAGAEAVRRPAASAAPVPRPGTKARRATPAMTRPQPSAAALGFTQAPDEAHFKRF
jgi:methyl-accepting chemotaxis protein